jgi:hypothetical protein
VTDKFAVCPLLMVALAGCVVMAGAWFDGVLLLDPPHAIMHIKAAATNQALEKKRTNFLAQCIVSTRPIER